MKDFLQKKLYDKKHLCDFLLKNKSLKGLLVPTGSPQQATGW